MMNRKTRRTNFCPANQRSLLLSFILIFSLCFEATAFQQTSKFKLEGQIKDQTGAAVSGATVIFTVGAAKLTAYADEEGRFDFQDLESNNGLLTIRVEGFTAFERRVNLQNTASLDIILAPASVA